MPAVKFHLCQMSNDYAAYESDLRFLRQQKIRWNLQGLDCKE